MGAFAGDGVRVLTDKVEYVYVLGFLGVADRCRGFLTVFEKSMAFFLHATVS